MEERRYSEEQLIDPALYVINNYPEGITTGQLIKVLEDLLKPKGEDVEILFGRKDSRFSQKVRNLISHKSIYPEYVDYDSTSSLLKIHNKGKERLLSSSFYKELAFAENSEIKFDFDGDEDLQYACTDYSDMKKGFVSCEPLNYSVFELKRRYDRSIDNNAKGVLILDDSFQRKSVWNRKQKSQLIESLLLAIPIPYLYLYEGKYGNLIVIDGRQRLSAIFEFMNNKYKLSNLEFLKSLNGKNAKDLIKDSTNNEDNYLARLEDSHLYVIKVGYETDELFKLKIFERVNQNGTKLNGQELRHALHQGVITEVLKELSDNTKFLAKAAMERMKDRYLILRYICMRLHFLGNLNYYFDNDTTQSVKYEEINSFLANGMDAINTFSDSQINEIKIDFEESYATATRVFGKDAFKMDANAPINMILFEITLLFTSLSKSRRKRDSDLIEMIRLFKNYDKEMVDENGNTPFFNNIKYHRDGKANYEERIEWLKKILLRCEAQDDCKNTDRKF